MHFWPGLCPSLAGDPKFIGVTLKKLHLWPVQCQLGSTYALTFFLRNRQSSSCFRTPALAALAYICLPEVAKTQRDRL